MAIPITVNGQTFNYPENRESPGWGTDASGFAQAVASALSVLASPTDLPQTLGIIANNQASPANVQSLTFDVLKVRSAFINYSVYRSLVNGSTYVSEYAEAGTIYIVYKSGTGTWELGQQKVGSSGPGAGVVFSITNSGQIQYTSDNMPGTGTYTGQMRFSARTTFAV